MIHSAQTGQAIYLPCEHLRSGIRERTSVAMRLFVVAFMLIHILYVNHAFARPSMTGKAVTNVGDVGEHYQLFLIEKVTILRISPSSIQSSIRIAA